MYLLLRGHHSIHGGTGKSFNVLCFFSCYISFCVNDISCLCIEHKDNAEARHSTVLSEILLFYASNSSMSEWIVVCRVHRGSLLAGYINNDIRMEVVNAAICGKNWMHFAKKAGRDLFMECSRLCVCKL